jgi:hypothetical protein
MKVGVLITQALEEQKRREEDWLYGQSCEAFILNGNVPHFANNFIYLRYFEYCRRPKIWRYKSRFSS